LSENDLQGYLCGDKNSMTAIRGAFNVLSLLTNDGKFVLLKGCKKCLCTFQADFLKDRERKLEVIFGFTDKFKIM
jgi:hypothetical protein